MEDGNFRVLTAEEAKMLWEMGCSQIERRWNHPEYASWEYVEIANNEKAGGYFPYTEKDLARLEFRVEINDEDA